MLVPAAESINFVIDKLSSAPSFPASLSSKSAMLSVFPFSTAPTMLIPQIPASSAIEILKHYNEKDNCWKEIKKIFKPNKNFLITEINEKNLLYESQEIKDWCKNKFIELECQKLEDKEQEKIKSFYQILIDVDKELSKIAEGREIDGS